MNWSTWFHRDPVRTVGIVLVLLGVALALAAPGHGLDDLSWLGLGVVLSRTT